MTRKLTDRRGRPRFEIVGDLWGAVELSARLEVLNAGRGGALLASPIPLVEDSVHTLAVIAAGERQVVSALVRHSRPGTGKAYLIGVEFLDLPEAVASVIDRYVADGGAAARSAVEA